MSHKQRGVCIYVECRGGVVEGKELDPNLMSFFSFSFFFYIMRLLLLGTRSFVQRLVCKEQNL